MNILFKPSFNSFVKNNLKNKEISQYGNNLKLCFKLSNNNIICSVIHLDKIVFWNSCKRYSSKSSFKIYSYNSVFVLCNSVLTFLKSNQIFSNLSLSLTFVGLFRFRLNIIKFFLKKKFIILDIIDLQNIAHNGVRLKKCRRLPKKKKLKKFNFMEFFSKKKYKF